MSELSVFVDESGNLGRDSKYYILSLVFHDQTVDVSGDIASYERLLRERGLQNKPFHLVPLTHGNEAFANEDIEARTRYLFSFASFARRIPFRYKTFVYRKSEFADRTALGKKMKRDIIEFLFENLERFQEFDAVKIYYDDGQRLIANALHGAFEYALWQQALVYREATPSLYRLAQIADLVCGIEHAALKYERHEEGKTDLAFFGTWRDFKKNFLKKLRKHRL